MFKLIKFVIKLVLLLIFLSPLITLAFMYKDYKAPLEDFQSVPNASFTDIATRKIDLFLEDKTQEAINMTLDAPTLNSVLKSIYAKDNPSFGLSDETIDELERKYAIKFGEYGGFKGVTVDFVEGGLNITAGVEAGFKGIYYKTAVEIKLGIIIDQVKKLNPETNEEKLETEIVLKVKDVKVGNLPVFFMYDFINDIAFKLFKVNINSLIEDVTTDFGTFDIENRQVIMDTDDLLKLLEKENDPTLNALVNIINELELIESTFSDTEGGVKVNLRDLESTKQPYAIENKITNDQEMQLLLQGQLTNLLLSSLVSQDNLKYDMQEMVFNQLLDYYVKDSMDIKIELPIGETTYELSTKPLFAEFMENEVHFYIILNMAKQGDTTNVFQTHIRLDATPSVSENKEDLIFTITGLAVGDDKELSIELVESILEIIGKDNEIIQGNQIVLEDMLLQIASQGVTVESVVAKPKFLEFTLKPTGANAEIFEELKDAIETALTVSLNEPGYEDVKASFDNVMEQLLTPGANPSDISTDALVESINNLTPEQQEQLFASLLSNLESLIPDISDLIPSN